MTTLYDFTATTIDGQERQLSDYEGKAVPAVNTASKCGFTPQYEGLEHLYGERKDDGLVVLGAKIKWNFTKFLVNRRGEVVKRYASTTKPDNLTGDIDDVLRS
ncbi:MAG: hypothetical protein WKF58_01020 [Ilumatobacteraceae bacterium]